MNRKFFVTLSISAAVLFLSAGALVTTRDDREQFLEHRAVLAMREIGHKILLNAGDSSSLVLPVKRLTPFIFQIDFQNTFAFTPDTLVSVIHRSLSAAALPLHYIVNVRDCENNAVVYGYELKSNSRKSLACLGRSQSKQCYYIQIIFTEWAEKNNSNAKNYAFAGMLAGITGLAFVGRILIKRKQVTSTSLKNGTAIGKFSFDSDKGLLHYKDKILSLSDKETKLLIIFAHNKNQLVDRDHLLKEVWEKDGVIVGRSLDMFVSKLRKKLQDDVSIRITNIHGKGYKLEIDPAL